MRYLISLGLGFAVALGLFAVMNSLVNSNRHELVQSDDNRISEFIRLQRPETIKEKKREIPKPAAQETAASARDENLSTGG